MKKYPYLNIKLYEASTAKQIAALEQSKLDIGVVRAPVISTKVDSKLWLRDSFSLVYNNQIIKEHVTDLKDLQNEVFVFFNKDYAPTYHSLLLQICAYHGFIPNLVHESNNVNSIIQLVRYGLGISIVPSSIIHNHAYRELSFIDLGGEYTTEVLIATPKNNKSVITEVVSEYLLS